MIGRFSIVFEETLPRSLCDQEDPGPSRPTFLLVTREKTLLTLSLLLCHEASLLYSLLGVGGGGGEGVRGGEEEEGRRGGVKGPWRSHQTRKC